jgi:hypothetical protein
MLKPVYYLLSSADILYILLCFYVINDLKMVKWNMLKPVYILLSLAVILYILLCFYDMLFF